MREAVAMHTQTHAQADDEQKGQNSLPLITIRSSLSYPTTVYVYAFAILLELTRTFFFLGYLRKGHASA